MEPKYIVAFEIGSSKVKGAVGTVDDSGILSVVAVEEEPMLDAVRYGVVRKIEEVANRLHILIQRLEESPAVQPGRISGVYISLGGQSLASCAREVEATFEQETEISKEMVRRLKEQVRSKGVPDREVVAVLAKDFMVDSLSESNPIGTYGRNLRAHLNLIYCRPMLKRNLAMVFENRLGLAINGYIVRPLAVADMVLTEDERHLGSMLVDFGAETTTVSIYRDGVLQYLATIPMGSRNITRDITATKIIEKRAEEMKKLVGNVEPNSVSSQFEGAMDNTEINKYIHARVSEIITNIVEQISFAGFKPESLPGGIVVIGGGARLRGFNQLLSVHSSLKVRQGIVSSNIRIADSYINPADNVDVIAILNFATRFPYKECVFIPEVKPEPEIEATAPDEEISRIGSDLANDEPIKDDPFSDTPEATDPHKRVKPKPNILDKFMTRVMSILEDKDQEE